MFKEFGMIFLIIIVHEFGHFLIAYCLKWKLDKITIFPFGGCVKFDEKINKPIKEEIFILLGGPFFQVLLFVFVYYLSLDGIITYRNFLIFKTYHYTLLVFNLLPIYPLDGGRLINLLFNYFFPYKVGNKIEIFFSIIIVIFLACFYRNFNYTLMSIFLFFELIAYLKNQDYLYNKMLLERYMFNLRYKKYKVIKNKDSMFKNKRHVVFYNDKYITEKDYLNERFR